MILPEGCTTVREILAGDSEVTDVAFGPTPGLFTFRLRGLDFLMKVPVEGERGEAVQLWARGDSLAGYPHVSPWLCSQNKKKIDQLNSGWREVCLYEGGTYVWSLVTPSDKVQDALHWLKALLDMNAVQRENELRAEFMCFWDHAALSKTVVNILLGPEGKFERLDIYNARDGRRCLVSRNSLPCNADGAWLSWIKATKNNSRDEAFFIPIYDPRDIFPPTEQRPWGPRDIAEIVWGGTINHLSDETFEAIKVTKANSKNAFLVFELPIRGGHATFAAKVEFANTKSEPLLDKLRRGVVQVLPIKGERLDLPYLHGQIGNDAGLLGKKALVVGAGSLGSYVIKELWNNGFANITVFDGDRLEPENALRWAYTDMALSMRGNKAKVIKQLLERAHPEAHITAKDHYLTAEKLRANAKDFDLIVFAVGDGDLQLGCNRVLREAKCRCPVFYAWFEAGGGQSHILKVEYDKPGCFECLFTDAGGEPVNNRVDAGTGEVVGGRPARNGCRATRVAYGTSVILRTVGALLDCVKEALSGEAKPNYLLDLGPMGYSRERPLFAMQGCRCCGDGD